MYDDLLGKKDSKEEEVHEITATIEFDMTQDKGCYQCGSLDRTILKEKLQTDCIERYVQCDACFTEWTETWYASGHVVGSYNV